MGGLSLKFMTEARSAEVLNFNEDQPRGCYVVYRVSQKKLTALKCKLVAPNLIGTKHIK